MTAKTRYVLISSFLVLFAGLGTGLVAYYYGLSTSALPADDGADELRLMPPGVTLVGFANLRAIMTSGVREHFRRALPPTPDGRERFRDETGIDVETDIDRVVVGLTPQGEGSQGAGLMLARGRFDAVRIESLMRAHGAQAADYKGVRLVTAPESPAHTAGLSLAFIEPGLVGLGHPSLVRAAVDLKSGGPNITSNVDVMKLVRSLDGGHAWAVGRFDAPASQGKLPGSLASQLSAIRWFAATAKVNGGVSGALRAEMRDEASAANLRDAIGGFLALARMHAGPRPELQTLVRSLDLSGAGASVVLSFMVTPELLDLFGAVARQGIPSAR
jgi:hypothetical protein